MYIDIRTLQTILGSVRRALSARGRGQRDLQRDAALPLLGLSDRDRLLNGLREQDHHQGQVLGEELLQGLCKVQRHGKTTFQLSLALNSSKIIHVALFRPQTSSVRYAATSWPRLRRPRIDRDGFQVNRVWDIFKWK